LAGAELYRLRRLHLGQHNMLDVVAGVAGAAFAAIREFIHQTTARMHEVMKAFRRVVLAGSPGA
jgi:hypothetical protein